MHVKTWVGWVVGVRNCVFSCALCLSLGRFPKVKEQIKKLKCQNFDETVGIKNEMETWGFTLTDCEFSGLRIHYIETILQAKFVKLDRCSRDRKRIWRDNWEFRLLNELNADFLKLIGIKRENLKRIPKKSFHGTHCH